MTTCFQFSHKFVAQAKQVMGISLGVVEVGRGERPFAPIHPLELFVQHHPKRLLQYISQPHTLVSQNSSRPLGVEQVVQVPVVLLLHQNHVVFGRVQNFLHRRVLHQLPQPIKVQLLQRVYNVIVGGGRNLYQTDAFTVDVHAVRFQIKGNSWLISQSGQTFLPRWLAGNEGIRRKGHIER